MHLVHTWTRFSFSGSIPKRGRAIILMLCPVLNVIFFQWWGVTSVSIVSYSCFGGHSDSCVKDNSGGHFGTSHSGTSHFGTSHFWSQSFCLLLRGSFILKANYCYRNGVQKSVLCLEGVPFSESSLSEVQCKTLMPMLMCCLHLILWFMCLRF